MSLYGTSNAFGKDIWVGRCVAQFLKTPGLLYNRMDATTPERIEGRNAFFKIQTQLQLGWAVIAEGGNYPQAVDSVYAEGKLSMIDGAATITLTRHERELLNSDTAAAEPIVAAKMRDGVAQFARQLARLQYQDGTGKLARCATSTATTTVNLQTSVGDTGSANDYDRNAATWLGDLSGSYIDIVDATTGAAIANGTGRQVQSVTRAANGGLSSIVIDAAGGNVTTSSSHVITWSASVAPFSSGTYTSGETGFPGLLAMVASSGTYLNINPATFPQWVSTVVTGSTAGTNDPFSLERLLTLYNRMALVAPDGMEPSAATGHELFSNYGVMGNAVIQLGNQIRFMDPRPGDTPSFGWRRVEGLGIPWNVDVRAPRFNLFALKMSNLYRVRPTNPVNDIFSFTTSGGDMWHLANASSGQGHADKWNAYLAGLIGFMTYARKDHGKLDDIVESGV